ncbi:gamma-tubulin complex, DGRIP84/SPC97 component [Phellopilus nigrolimitatus]|nr:gamma-tubulin complex, DGRIP84/SPC97 component [Phellopilus nigrolimitatus]
MDPFTPKKRSTSRKNKLTLSAKQYSKIAGTIASVRRSRLGDLGEDAEHIFRESDEPSFIAERSFVSAPLNSRVPVQQTSAKGKGKAKAESLDKVPLEVQEALILEDLLFVLMGIEGTYITYPLDYSLEDENPLHGVRFVAAPSLDPSLRDLVERILPLATFYTAISSFIQIRSHLDYGLVNHSLCAAIRDMLKDYHTLLSQLEHAFASSPTFSLQKLWFYVHPTLHTLSLIYGLTTELVEVEDPPESESSEGSSSDELDPEEQARNEALGLGGAKLKAVLTEIKGGLGESGAVAGPAKGGEVLAILHERLQRMSGDPSALALYRALVRAAGRPYAEMLVAWTRSGKLDDPYEELCVKESRSINKGDLDVDYTDEYWERRYTLRDGSTISGGSKRHLAGVPLPRTPSGRLPGGACIPPLLESWKSKVLLSGKYLNVLQECGKEIKRPAVLNDDDLAMEGDKFYKSIEDAYSFANRTLVNVLMHDQQLIPRLRSLKHYFFLSQSAFLTNFLDAAHTELRKPSRHASRDKLQSLLDVALNLDGSTFAAEGEPTFKEDVKVDMGTSGLYEWLLKIVSVNGVIGGDENGDMGVEMVNEDAKKSKDKDEKDKSKLLAIDAFVLDYKVKFPLSLVISRKTIVRYQLLFRFLLHLRHVEQALLAMWTEHTTAPWRGRVPAHPEFERWRRHVFLLRARMLAFVQQILAFATAQVLEPNWRRLEATLARVGTVDELLRAHVDFLDTCLKECMLTSAKLIRAYERLITTCMTFALYNASFTKTVNQALGTLEAAGGDASSVPMEKRWDFLTKFDKNFDHWFNTHLDCVQYYASSENGALLPLVTRLTSIKAMKTS